MTTETRELVERLTGLLAKATPGPMKVETQLLEAVEDDDDPEVYVIHPGTVCDYSVFATIGRSRFVSDEQKQANAALIVAAVNALPHLLATITRLTEEVERLRGLLIDPGDPAWEDARGVLEWELRKAGMDTHADNIAAGHPVAIPSWFALNLIAQAARSTLARSGSHG